MKRHKLDALGLTCPEPIMLLHGAIRDAQVGDLVVMTATDPSTKKDVARFCEYLGHTLQAQGEEDGVYIYEIVKGES